MLAVTVDNPLALPRLARAVLMDAIPADQLTPATTPDTRRLSC
jgi:hypothetical protein